MSSVPSGILPEARVRELVQRYQEGDAQAFDEIYPHIVGMVIALASRYYRSGTCGNETVEDLAQWGWIGVVKALEKFDFRESSKFSSYASYWIRAYIHRDGQRAGTALKTPYHATEKRNRASLSRTILAQELQREPTKHEISLRSGVDERYVEIVGASMYSLDKLVPNKKGTYGEALADPQVNVEESIFEKFEMADLASAIESLPDDERNVVLLCFGLDGKPKLTLSEISKSPRVSRETVRARKKRALLSLRRYLD